MAEEKCGAILTLLSDSGNGVKVKCGRKPHPESVSHGMVGETALKQRFTLNWTGDTKEE